MALNQKLPQVVLPYHPCPYLDLPLKEKDHLHHQIQVEALDQILQFLAVLLRAVHLLVAILRLLVVVLEAYLLLKVYILNMKSY
jgi:hypothetical protein